MEKLKRKQQIFKRIEKIKYLIKNTFKYKKYKNIVDISSIEVKVSLIFTFIVIAILGYMSGYENIAEYRNVIVSDLTILAFWFLVLGVIMCLSIELFSKDTNDVNSNKHDKIENNFDAFKASRYDYIFHIFVCIVTSIVFIITAILLHFGVDITTKSLFYVYLATMSYLYIYSLVNSLCLTVINFAMFMLRKNLNEWESFIEEQKVIRRKNKQS